MSGWLAGAEATIGVQPMPFICAQTDDETWIFLVPGAPTSVGKGSELCKALALFDNEDHLPDSVDIGEFGKAQRGPPDWRTRLCRL
jgi:hypothetical protein